MQEPIVPSTRCNQCGLLHPPILEGSKCPMAKHIDDSGQEIDYGNFLANLKNIVVSQIDIKKIKNPAKMFAKLIVEFMKMVEGYEENE